MRGLQDKKVLITGAAQGIGLACARRFLEEGAHVALLDHNGDALERAAASLGDDAHVRRCAADVSSKAQVDAAVTELIAHWGRIDVLINNAGITHAAEFLDIAEADFDRVIGVNLKGYFLVGQAVARAMAKATPDAQGRRGAIVNMSSVNGLLAMTNQVPYNTSKGGVNQLTRVMALSLAPYGIRVNAVGPGTILTELARNAVLGSDEARRRILSRTPIGRCGEPEEVASVAAFLASDDASYMTGQIVYVDGGRLALNYTVPVPD